MTWTAPGVERPRPPLDGGERGMLEGFLDLHRATLLRQRAGLTGAQPALPAAEPSKPSLLGLVRHLTDIEYWWFTDNVAGRQDCPRPRATGTPRSTTRPGTTPNGCSRPIARRSPPRAR